MRIENRILDLNFVTIVILYFEGIAIGSLHIITLINKLLHSCPLVVSNIFFYIEKELILRLFHTGC